MFCLFQIMLGEYAANVSSEELYTPGAKFLFIVNYFTIVFFRCLVSAMAIISYVNDVEALRFCILTL